MFRNYFKVALRGLMKSPLNSFINIFGLSVGISLCIFAYAFARWTYSTDQFHEHKNSVYMVTFFADREGTAQHYGLTPRPLGEMLRADFAHIEKVCRIEDRSVVIKYGEHVFHERVRYVDPEFLEMFSFPLKWGTPTSLADVNSIILSEAVSIKYFGDENPIGRDILIKFDQDRSKAFKVTGVAKDFPKARTISFNFLINFQNLKTSEPTYDFNDWKAFVNATMIQVQNPSHLESIQKGMIKYKNLQNEVVQKDWAISSFSFEPLATLHERSEDIRDDISRSSKDNYTSVIYMAVISAFLLALACFNYINIAIVSATKRLKEIGVRKSVGATRGVVIIQFLSENIVITFFSLFLGLILAMTFFIPSFERLFSFSMDFRLNDRVLWVYLPAILLFTCIASGIYPSLYVSRFHVTGILKGSVKFGTRNGLTKILLGFQLIMACIFISSSVYFTQNSDYLAKRSWGYNQAETLYANVPDQAAYERLHALMVQEPDVLSISGSAHHVGKNHTTTFLHFPDREYEANQLAVDAKYFETMGLELKQGRVFEDHEGSDRQTVVVNELLAQNMGWENPMGKLFRMDSAQYEVIGVVRNFHSYNFFTPLRPTLFTVADKTDYRFLSIKVRSGAEMKAYKALQANWAELFPEVPFEGGHQQDVWGFYFEEIKIHGMVWRVFAIIAVALASLGLYGLMTLNVAGRTREFSIRKILGAEAKNIAGNIAREYIALFVVAIVFGGPVSYLLTKLLIEFSYTYHMPITYFGVGPAIIIMILILFVPVSLQIRRVLRSNPVEGLKAE
jgi:putative ABC transport system permease protein